MRGLQHGLQCDQRLASHDWRARKMQVITRGRFTHPGWHFQRTVISLVVEAAPADRIS
jgi:hypothetical protein